MNVAGGELPMGYRQAGIWPCFHSETEQFNCPRMNANFRAESKNRRVDAWLPIQRETLRLFHSRSYAAFAGNWIVSAADAPLVCHS